MLDPGTPRTRLSAAILETRETGEFVQGGELDAPNFFDEEFTELRVKDPIWRNGNFTLATFQAFRCVGGALTNGIWTGAAMDEVHLFDCALSYGLFDDILFRRAVASVCKFTHSSFVDVDFSDTDFSASMFDLSNLSRAVLHRVKATGALFRMANVDGADFRDADLRKADFRGASLVGTNFEGANLEGALFGELPDELKRLLM